MRPLDASICVLPLRDDEGIGLFPAVLLFTAAARMVRPVYHIDAGLTEWVGNLGEIRNTIGGKVVAMTD